MGRINIEDSLYKDLRWQRFSMHVGDLYRAKGMLLTAWTIAQENWLKYRAIPLKAWPKDLDPLIDFELAIRLNVGSEEFIYVKGSKEQFKWLEQKSKAGASKSEKKLKSAEKARKKKLEQKEAVLNGRSEEHSVNSERSLNGSERKESCLNGSEAHTHTHTHTHTLSLSHSPSSSSDSVLKNTSKNNEASASKKESAELNRKIWEAYASSFSERYRVQPTRNASVNAKISQLGKRLGEDAVNVVKFFLKHNDGFYLKKVHDIGLCLKDAESLHVQMQRGQTVTSQDVRNFERTANVVNLVNEARKGGF